MESAVKIKGGGKSKEEWITFSLHDGEVKVLRLNGDKCMESILIFPGDASFIIYDEEIMIVHSGKGISFLLNIDKKFAGDVLKRIQSLNLANVSNRISSV